MSTQLHLNLMQSNAAEIARNAEAGRHAASLGSRRGVKQTARTHRGLLRLVPVLRHS